MSSLRVACSGNLGIELGRQGQFLNYLSALIDQGAIKHTLTRTLPWTVASMVKAHELLESSRSIGKLALTLIADEASASSTLLRASASASALEFKHTTNAPFAPGALLIAPAAKLPRGRNAVAELLRTTPLSDVIQTRVFRDRQVLTVKSTDTLASSVKTMAKHSILSMPVVDEESEQRQARAPALMRSCFADVVQAFISFLEIGEFIATAAGDSGLERKDLEDIESLRVLGRNIAEATVGEIIGARVCSATSFGI